jgi:hypothetical protein
MTARPEQPAGHAAREHQARVLIAHPDCAPAALRAVADGDPTAVTSPARET